MLLRNCDLDLTSSDSANGRRGATRDGNCFTDFRGPLSSCLFWWLLTIACVVWYSSITIYVAYKGVTDIRNMLKNLAKRNAADG